MYAERSRTIRCRRPSNGDDHGDDLKESLLGIRVRVFQRTTSPLVSACITLCLPELDMKRRNVSSKQTEAQANADDRDDDPPFLDQDDQAALIRDLQTQAAQQQEMLYFIFKFLCTAASFASVVAALWVTIEHDDNEIREELQQEIGTTPMAWVWIHAVLSLFLHSIASNRSRSIRANYDFTSTRAADDSSKIGSRPTMMLWTALILLTANGALWWWTTSDNNSGNGSTKLLHAGLLLGNVTTLVLGWLLQVDAQSTREAMAELEASKYRHKEL